VRGEHVQRCSVRCHEGTNRFATTRTDPLTTADATTTEDVLTRGLQATRCRVRCHQRIRKRKGCV
jgi:hypothetical protein